MKRWMALTALGIALGVSLGAANSAPDAVTYSIGPKAMVQTLYPDASWLPEQYKQDYPDLAATIRKYTLQSLQRDGVKNASVTVTFPKAGKDVQVSITPKNAVTQAYAKLHPAFLDAQHGQLALQAVQACEKDKTSCWKEPNPPKNNQPWAFYLPLGMAMVTHQAVMFMDYPPAVSLKQGDYLQNYTMCRWNQVLAAAGVSDPVSTNVIVDARPIAAPGAGMDALMPYPPEWFNGPKGAVYLTPMLQLRTARQAASATSTLPVAVFGSKPRDTWGAIVGQKDLKVGSVGETALGGQAKKTGWITANHPDVTPYNCCPGDKSAKCGGSFSLIADEQADFVTACWIKTMASPKAPGATQAKEQCTAAWVTQPSTANKQALCVQAKLFDNNSKEARCTNYEDAWNYCAANNGNACASLDCSYDKSKAKLPVPPPAKRPYTDKSCW